MLTDVMITFVLGTLEPFECTIRCGDTWREKPKRFAFTVFFPCLPLCAMAICTNLEGFCVFHFPNEERKWGIAPVPIVQVKRGHFTAAVCGISNKKDYLSITCV